LPQFEGYSEKWEFIMSIPSFVPRKNAKDLFYREVKRRVAEIPTELENDVKKFLDELLNNEKTHPVMKDEYQKLINAIG